MLSKAELEKKIRNREHRYESLLRNDYFPPSIKSSICTKAWMEKVRFKEIFCPKVSSIRLRNCPQAPGRETLLDMLE